MTSPLLLPSPAGAGQSRPRAGADALRLKNVLCSRHVAGDRLNAAANELMIVGAHQRLRRAERLPVQVSRCGSFHLQHSQGKKVLSAGLLW
jgi:hypothetical protein